MCVLPPVSGSAWPAPEKTQCGQLEVLRPLNLEGGIERGRGGGRERGGERKGRRGRERGRDGVTEGGGQAVAAVKLVSTYH